ncbi:family 78 glycoside hydrolase catalytic domain [Georgenia sp. MJ170]|uniref:family 78 glycoside hydrolase catalytic domain n=1 Tax=Georgenia sunbinii TaxID=3117728 RepID=UPI002F2624F3
MTAHPRSHVSPVHRPRWLLAVVLAMSLVVALLGPLAPSRAEVHDRSVGSLLVNGLSHPLGIGSDDPRLSWQLDAERRGVTQTAYQVRAASTVDALEDADLWDSGRVDSDQQLDVPWGGPDLAPATRTYWQVRVWDETDTASAWSEPAWFETGLFSAEDWSADWIGSQGPEPIGTEWTDVTISVTASDIDGALGIYLRGRDDANAYMWQLSESDNALRPHVKVDGGYSVLEAAPFAEDFDWAATHDYEIAVEGDTITTSVDGEVVDVTTDATHADPGIMGFRTSGAESGLIHSVTVTSADGTVLVEDDFTTDAATFRAGTYQDGALLVSGGAEAWLTVPDPVPVLRTEFATADVVDARVYASARGIYELTLNGEPVGDHELAPGWTDYRARIAHQTYDVTDLVRDGANALGAELADGWWSGSLGMFGPDQYGSDTSLIAELHLTLADGTTQVVTTDDTWVTTDGPRTAADPLHGESYDARRAAELAGWDEPGFDVADWQPVEVRDSATDRLEPQIDPPVRETQELSATYLSSPAEDTWIYDLGQNMVGKVRVTLDGEAGDTVRLRHAEVLNQDGTMYTANLRSAKATDYVTLTGDGPVTYEPEFTFHGFRYVEISGVSEPPDAADVVGVVVGTDGELVSELDTSSDLIDQLHSNIVWGMRGNFLSIPTDTPARDERLGWTGDINVFARTAVYNMDSQAFLTKWLQDLRDSQRADGALPGIAPIIPGTFDGGYGPAGWMDAGVNVPWTLWQAYGDTTVIRENLDMMTRYVDYLEASSTDGIRSVGGYNDWLNLDDDTPVPVVDTAFVAKSSGQLAEMAEAIGEDEVAERYQQMHDDVRAAYIDAFVGEDGTVHGDSQTAYVLTITNDLVPEELREALTEQFIETLERRDWHLSTGFLGVDGLLPALTAVGRTDVAYRLLQNTDYPSWGYEIGHGATTIWERWNSIMPDGSFGPVGMNSFNHYAYGAVGEWMYRTMAGVSALEPGYRSILIAPEPGSGIDAVDFSHETRYGTVRSAWEQTADGLEMAVTIPAGATATVRVPAPGRWAVTEGALPAEDAEAVTFVAMDDGDVVYEIGSGSYDFAVDPALGHLGDARAGVAELQSVLTELADLPRGLVSPLTAHADRLERQVDDAWQAQLAGTDRVATDVHLGLNTAAHLASWVEHHRGGRLDEAAADRISAAVDAVSASLSAASAELVGAVARVEVPSGTVYPGEQVPVDVVVENAGDQRLGGLDVSLDVPAGWLLTPVGSAPGSVPANGSATLSYELAVPDDAAPGTAAMTGEVRYRYQAGGASIPVATDIAVGPAVAVVDVTAEPVVPGGTTELAVTLRNRGPVDATRALELSAPAGWTVAAADDVSVPAGQDVEIHLTAAAPLTVTEGGAPLTVAVGDTASERFELDVAVTFSNPPASFTDHIDLGDAASEEAHNLTASPASGTSVEAGLTRRYTNTTVPGGWFEFDLEVPAGEPFVLRSIETYDMAQLKDYTVSIDGEVVHERAHRRSDGGAGTVSYQFVVEPSDATADGVVRVRFQDTGTGYDPSIADVWVTTTAHNR